MTDDRDRRAIGRWLVACAVSIAVLVLIGGATRLTESGLSITEWQPVSGVVPPLSADGWQAEFTKYQRIPQFARQNPGMSLPQFKVIFLWEYTHRLWARLVGLAFALPFAWLVIRRRVPRAVLPRLAGLVILLGAQGAMGWWMVQSGLTQRTSVSQYRLAAHLAMALVIYAWTVWTAADLLDAPATAREPGATPSARALGALTAMIGLTALSGAFVAGLRAGKIYNTFPMMGGGIVPAGYGALSPAWRNAFENPSAVQFNHRVLALTTSALAVLLWSACRRTPSARFAGRMRFVLSAALLQVTLGISALLLGVPVALGVAHQGGAVLLLTAALLALHGRPR